MSIEWFGGNNIVFKLLNSNIVRLVIEYISVILGLINRFIPKKKKSILLFDSKEVYLNNYAMYRYMIENDLNKKYKIYYSMPGLKKRLGSPPENVTFFRGFFMTTIVYLTSSICFLDTGNLRIKPSRKQEVLNLWHGTPLKKIGLSSNSNGSRLHKNTLNVFSHVLVSSSNFIEIFKDAFDLKKEQIIIAGQPRLDSLYKSSANLKKLGVDISKFKKVIMWMTTYRISYDNRLNHTSDKSWSKTNLPIITSMKEVKKLNDYLYNNRVFMIIKIHQGSKFTKKELQSLSNILVIQDEDFISKKLQLYEILAQCDALITDYSSVYFDYLLLNRQIGFIIDDIEDYNKKNGFVFENPLDYMPGNKIKNLDQIFNFIQDVLTENDNYREQRKILNIFVNEYQDNLNCERAFKIATEKES